MTFRQLLAVLWARKWIVVVVLFALIGAGGYLALRTVSYSSEGTVRLNAVVSGGATSDDVGGVAVNFGVETITSPEVLDAAGALISTPGSDLAGQVKASLVDDGHVTKADVVATGPTPRSAQQMRRGCSPDLRPTGQRIMTALPTVSSEPAQCEQPASGVGRACRARAGRSDSIESSLERRPSAG